jgi:hypothetical protein
MLEGGSSAIRGVGPCLKSFQKVTNSQPDCYQWRIPANIVYGAQ